MSADVESLIVGFLVGVYFMALWVDAADSFKQEMRHSGWRAFLMPSWRARRTARALLMAHLTPAQRWRFRLLGTIEVIGNRTGRHYRIRQHYTYAITERYGGFAYRLWCANLVGGRYPLPDQMLALKLLIESDEDGFRSIAYSTIPFGRPF